MDLISAQERRKRPEEHGKTVVFNPADLRGFRNGTDMSLQWPQLDLQPFR